jgi:alcohol dehydrogenase class IV
MCSLTTLVGSWMQFDFATAARILFGRRVRLQLPKLAAGFGRRALVVTGRSTERVAETVSALAAAGVQCSIFGVSNEPTMGIVREGAAAAREVELVIGFGGGSAIDAAKAIAAMASNSGEPLDYLEVVGRGRPLENAPLPWIAVPTTAGTGAEVTRNAVLDSPEHGVKASLRSPLLLANAAVIDPELTLDLPPRITADCGLDTLTQLIEPYVSVRANPFTDLLCVEGLNRVASSLVIAFQNGANTGARESMCFASLLSGLALANAGLGVVHGFAGPLGGTLHARHGALCAAVLPVGVAANIQALRKRAPDHPALERYRNVACILTGRPEAGPEDLITSLMNLNAELSVSALRIHGLQKQQIPDLVEKAARASSMKANPVVLTPDELTEVVERAF